LPGDLDLTEWVQDWPQPAETASEAIRAVTGTEVAIAAGAVLAVALFAARRPWLAGLDAVLFSVLPFAQRAVKVLVDRPRPSAELVDIRGVGTSPSFPSGHVLSGTVLFGAIVVLGWALPLPMAWRWAITAVAIVMAIAGGFANVYEGVHWPSDVLGGWAWAAVLLLPFAAAARACARNPKSRV
jgi:undecaprenyl-diphosphatase